MTYGKSDAGNLAVSRAMHYGVWESVEAIGDRYHIVEYENLNEDEMDRVDELARAVAERSA